MPSLTFTLDLEEHREDPTPPARFPDLTRRVVEFFADNDISATFFVVASVAQAQPQLIRDIVAAGHQVASHSFDHTTLEQQTPDAFRAHTKQSRQILEDIISAPIIGYRAPVFSLTERTRWAVDILGELGFRYSSSVLPARNPLHGFPGLPECPFRWPNGLLELPAPLLSIGPAQVPFLGGFYLRYLPRFLIARGVRSCPPQTALWTYIHPYDFDTEEPFSRIRGAPLWVSVALWFHRGATFSRLQYLLSLFAENTRFDSFEARLASGEFDQAPRHES